MTLFRAIGVEAKTQAFLDKINSQNNWQIQDIPVEMARENLVQEQSSDTEKLPADIHDISIITELNYELAVRIVRPFGNPKKLPVVMYFHGGGWVIGDKHTHDRLIRQIANGANAAVVFVEYSRAPEVQYPTANEEAYAATKWVVENSDTINVDNSHLVVAGDSAGANMAIAVTLLAKERREIQVNFQVLINPTTDANFNTPSFEEFSEGYLLTSKAMMCFWNHYLPDVIQRNNITVSPLQASIEQLKGLPSALVITSEFDILRDQGEAFAHKLVEAGVTTTSTRYLGTIHAFTVLNAIADTPAAQAAISQITRTLRMVFSPLNVDK